MSEVNSMGDRNIWANDYTAALAEKAAWDKVEEARRQQAATDAAVALRAPLVDSQVVILGYN